MTCSQSSTLSQKWLGYSSSFGAENSFKIWDVAAGHTAKLILHARLKWWLMTNINSFVSEHQKLVSCPGVSGQINNFLHSFQLIYYKLKITRLLPAKLEHFNEKLIALKAKVELRVARNTEIISINRLNPKNFHG